MHDPLLLVTALATVELVVVQLVCDQGQDLGLVKFVGLPLREFRFHLEQAKWVG